MQNHVSPSLELAPGRRPARWVSDGAGGGGGRAVRLCIQAARGRNDIVPGTGGRPVRLAGASLDHGHWPRRMVKVLKVRTCAVQHGSFAGLPLDVPAGAAVAEAWCEMRGAGLVSRAVRAGGETRLVTGPCRSRASGPVLSGERVATPVLFHWRPTGPVR